MHWRYCYFTLVHSYTNFNIWTSLNFNSKCLNVWISTPLNRFLILNLTMAKGCMHHYGKNVKNLPMIAINIWMLEHLFMFYFTYFAWWNQCFFATLSYTLIFIMYFLMQKRWLLHVLLDVIVCQSYMTTHVYVTIWAKLLYTVSISSISRNTILNIPSNNQLLLISACICLSSIYYSLLSSFLEGMSGGVRLVSREVIKSTLLAGKVATISLTTLQ